MEAMMRRDAAAAKPFLSEQAYQQLCEDWTCMGLIGTSNPHHASWEQISRTDESDGTVLFVVRIHEEYTGYGETAVEEESIEIGPGQNYLGQLMDAVVLSAG
jgi:hypothetical protein